MCCFSRRAFGAKVLGIVPSKTTEVHMWLVDLVRLLKKAGLEFEAARLYEFVDLPEEQVVDITPNGRYWRVRGIYHNYYILVSDAQARKLYLSAQVES